MIQGIPNLPLLSVFGHGERFQSPYVTKQLALFYFLLDSEKGFVPDYAFVLI
jgi:hypothetical protein